MKLLKSLWSAAALGCGEWFQRPGQWPLHGRIWSFFLISALSSFCSAAPNPHSPEPFVSHFLQFDLNSAAKNANAILAHGPHNLSALFVRMEVAELQAQTSVMLD